MSSLRGRMVERIKRLWARTSAEERVEGARWYPRMRNEMTDISLSTGVPVWTAVQVLAILSPHCEIRSNVQQAERLLRWWRQQRRLGWPAAPPPRLSAYPRNITKAIRLLDREPVSMARSPKVSAFTAQILMGGDAQVVCVDGHLANAARGQRQGVKSARVTPRQYEDIEWAYLRAAAALGVPPGALQATVWLYWRRTWRRG